MGWFTQFLVPSSEQVDWTTIGPVRRTMERAKADAKEHLKGHRHLAYRIEYRLVRDDERHSIEQTSKPPHGWRMRWLWTV